MSAKYSYCASCGTEIPAGQKVCPHCGKNVNGKPLYKKWWFWLILVVLAASIIGGNNKTGEQAAKPAQKPSSQPTQTVPDVSKSDSMAAVEEDEKIPSEYKAALKKAQSYSDMMHMSKKGIYNQLVSEYGENFPADAAQYAVDNLVADYNANALAKAKSYQSLMSMSHASIYDQLVSEYGEQFTSEEAQYAIDHLD